MLIICHRGLTDGPDAYKENHPDTIKAALKAGFGVECDAWYFKGGNWYLGHDSAQYKVSFDFINNARFVVHAKNIEALYQLSLYQGINSYWHETDAVTFTSWRWIWTFPGKETTPKSISVLPESHDITGYDSREEYYKSLKGKILGICSKYPHEIKKALTR